jgi:ABC-2 type transport system permease protein
LTTVTRDTAPSPLEAPSKAVRQRTVPWAKVFLALLRRDVTVARKELPFFLVRTVMQPVLFIIVFGALLPRMGFVGAGYTAALLPGILAISLTMSAIQAVSLPMMQDFGWTKEIEDRLLAPVPTRVVAAEKIVAAVMQALIAAIVVLPIARLIMGPIPGFSLAHGGEIALIALLGATAFSSLGMWLGTAISPQQIGLMFSVIVAPMIFFGCAYYPWRGLDAVPVVKYLVLLNPLVYVAEGLRGVMTPSVPHMSLGVVTVALVLLAIAGWMLGMRSFYRRAIG